MFRQILTEAQQTVLELLSRIAEIRTFYLAGGTALALHLGHRSLTFFEDAEAEVMPDLRIEVTWDEIKAFFTAEAARLFREL